MIEIMKICNTEGMKNVAHVTNRGQITLPIEVRKALSLKPGDPLVVRVEEGKIVLEPAVVSPVELYTEERLAEFAREAEMTSQELEEARRRWGL